MFLTEFQRFILPRIAAPLLGGLLLAAASQSGAHAAAGDASRGVYVIADHEGYGVVECLTQKKDCGKIVADSWCEAHGHGPALAFGRADDLTASIGPAASRSAADAGAAVVACGE